MLPQNTLIVFFDGECNLCNGAVQFIIKHNTGRQLKFASLQSEFGQKTLLENNKDISSFQTLFFLENNMLKERSEAVFAIVKYLPSYRFLRIFRFLPIRVSNFFYNLVSKNRFSWFGKPSSCYMPTAELSGRFVQ